MWPWRLVRVGDRRSFIYSFHDFSNWGQNEGDARRPSLSVPGLEGNPVFRGGKSGSYAPLTPWDGHKGCVYPSWFRLKSMRTRRSFSVSIPLLFVPIHTKSESPEWVIPYKRSPTACLYKRKRRIENGIGRHRCPAETTINRLGASAPSPCRSPSSAAAPSRSPSSDPGCPPGRRRTTPGRWP